MLRKQPLIFLHWYHHITVLIYSWFSYTEYTSSARWFIVMNYCVHSVMYSYYALRAARYNPPRFIAMLITSLQLAQMIIGCAINLWAQGFLRTHGPQSCNISQTNINLSIAMYFSYFVLFARFFYKTYLSSDGKKSRHLNINTNISKRSTNITSTITKLMFSNSSLIDSSPINANGRLTTTNTPVNLLDDSNNKNNTNTNTNTNAISNKINNNNNNIEEIEMSSSNSNYNTIYKTKTQ